MYKVIIIDDEAAGRQMIKEYLESYPELILVGEANNGVDGINIIREFKPDFVFLDIEMPGMTGFEMLTHLDDIPQIIFSTAYDNYALKAFEIHAIDYLLKPYTKERFDRTIERVMSSTSGNNAQPIAEQYLESNKGFSEKILVQNGRILKAINYTEIRVIQAYGDYSKILTEDKSFLSNHGITSLEGKLDPNVFIRVHRSSIISVRHIQKVEREGQSFLITMNNGTVVKVSRSHSDKVKKLIL